MHKPLVPLNEEVDSPGLDDLVAEIPNPPAWLQDALSVPRCEGYVDVNGCPIHYFRWGKPNNPGLLLTHGFLAHARCFAFIAPFLARDYHVVAFDMSGMGDSGGHSQYSQQVRVNELIGVAEQTGLFEHRQKPIIIAHSFGGGVSTEAAHQHPGRFAGLIICDLMIIRPSVLKANADRFGPPGHRDPNRPHRVYPDFATAKKRFVLSPPQATQEPVLFDYMAYHSLRKVDGGWSWKFAPAVFNREENFEQVWTEVGERVVMAPIKKAIIYGAQSMLFTADSEDYLRELVAEQQMDEIPIIAIPQAKHHLMLDQPIAFVTALKSILALWERV